MPRCNHVKTDGTRCRANAQARSECCFFHNPEEEAARVEASRRGGQAGAARALPGAPSSPIASSSDVCQLLGETLSQVRRGELDPKVSNAIGYLANIQLKALDQSRIESMLDEIVDAVRERPRRFASDVLTDVSHLED